MIVARFDDLLITPQGLVEDMAVIQTPQNSIESQIAWGAWVFSTHAHQSRFTEFMMCASTKTVPSLYVTYQLEETVVYIPHCGEEHVQVLTPTGKPVNLYEVTEQTEEQEGKNLLNHYRCVGQIPQSVTRWVVTWKADSPKAAIAHALKISDTVGDFIARVDKIVNFKAGSTLAVSDWNVLASLGEVVTGVRKQDEEETKKQLFRFQRPYQYPRKIIRHGR